ncbi:MAG: hypothetical protein K9H26_01510 [Prolixibacteraceae bacterium]|nr:hypothetical protein [Prolixibacteraceae bacterium]
MKTKFYTTAESGQTNRRGLKNFNENSMFNVKNVSLMKKQVLKIMMVLALGVGLGTNAWGQYNTGTAADPVTHVTGSTHTYTVSTDGGGTYSWSILRDAGGTAADPDDYTDVSGQAEATFQFTWTDEAADSYIVRVVDESAETCTTTRDFYVDVFTFDAWVYASTELGAEVTDWDDCGDNNDDATYIFDNALNDGAAPLVDPATADGTLQGEQGTIGTTRYISVQITFDGDIDVDPVYASIGFDYVVTAVYSGTGSATGDLQQFNAETVATGSSTIDGGGPILTTSISWNDRWGDDNDIVYSVTATNITLYEEDGGTGTILGEERQDKEGAQGDRIGGTNNIDANTSDDVTIYAAPATSVITVGP